MKVPVFHVVSKQYYDSFIGKGRFIFIVDVWWITRKKEIRQYISRSLILISLSINLNLEITILWDNIGSKKFRRFPTHWCWATKKSVEHKIGLHFIMAHFPILLLNNFSAKCKFAHGCFDHSGHVFLII